MSISVSDAQLRLLSSTKLSLLFSTLKLFVEWVKDGMYDFNTLPITLKVHLSKHDHGILKQIPDKYSGTPSNLLEEMKGLVDALLQTEPQIVKGINQLAQVSVFVSKLLDI